MSGAVAAAVTAEPGIRWRTVAAHGVAIVAFIALWELAMRREWLSAAFFGQPSGIVAFLRDGFAPVAERFGMSWTLRAASEKRRVMLLAAAGGGRYRERGLVSEAGPRARVA